VIVAPAAPMCFPVWQAGNIPLKSAVARFADLVHIMLAVTELKTSNISYGFLYIRKVSGFTLTPQNNLSCIMFEVFEKNYTSFDNKGLIVIFITFKSIHKKYIIKCI
jgi:hypothetical protein